MNSQQEQYPNGQCTLCWEKIENKEKAKWVAVAENSSASTNKYVVGCNFIYFFGTKNAYFFITWKPSVNI